MKKLFVLCLMAFFSLSLTANPVGVNKAKSLGIKFMSYNTSIKATDANLAYTAYADNGTACFYVFSMKPRGFVIVSADDRAKPILGYSTEGSFSKDEIPDGLQSFFKNYQAGFSQMMESDEAQTEMAANDWKRLGETGKINDVRITREVPKMLTSIWNQSALYNRRCPADTLGPDGHVYAGCVATAMSQIMNYWQWPRKGTGSYAYWCFPYGELMAFFGETEYRFDLMPDYLDWTSSPEEIDAVALLQYHAGVSVDMQYSPEGSGAYSFSVASALRNYFKYDDLLEMDALNWHSNAEWENMLRDNLDNGMPLYYSASGPDGGHAFVCDGYDANNMFHFNWGWQGLDNGYYAINGFYLSHYSFPEDHAAIFGIYPDEDYAFTPKGVEDFQVEAIDLGTNRISFVAPSMTMFDFPLIQVDTIVLLRNNEVIHKECGLPGGSAFSYDDQDAPGVSHYAVYAYSDVFSGPAVFDTILNGPACELTFHLHDSIGDGWTAQSISIVDSKGIAVKRVGLAEGSEATVTVEVPSGEEMTMHWAYSIGGKDFESYFEAYDWNGSLIYATDSVPVIGELCHFISDCGDDIAEIAENGIALYPNPTRSQVTVMGADVAQVDVFNIQGQRILTDNSNVIDLSDFVNGIYLIRVTTSDGQIWHHKLLKE